MFHVSIPVNISDDSRVVLSDSMRLDTTYLGADDGNGGVVLLEVKGAAALEALARALLDRAATVRRDEVATLEGAAAVRRTGG